MDAIDPTEHLALVHYLARRVYRRLPGSAVAFDDLMQRRFANLIASGEYAYFWRRIFYDVRKIHKLVWEDEFAATLMGLVQAGRICLVSSSPSLSHRPKRRDLTAKVRVTDLESRQFLVDRVRQGSTALRLRSPLQRKTHC